jgi:hypothetical protein
MAFSNDNGIAFSMTKEIEKINSKNPQTGGYAIPTEMVVQKYLQERINPSIPTTSILAALDQRKWEQKQQANAQAPQQTVLEETINEVQTANAPQGIQQGQPRPQPQQQMAGLQRPPMPGGVTPQQRMGTGIPMMAAAGGYVPNFADGGIIGYKERGYVGGNRYDPNAKPYTGGSDLISMSQEQFNALPSDAKLKYLQMQSFEEKTKGIKPVTRLQDVELNSNNGLTSDNFMQTVGSKTDRVIDNMQRLGNLQPETNTEEQSFEERKNIEDLENDLIKRNTIVPEVGDEVGNDFTGLGYEEQGTSADLKAFIDSQKTLPGKEVVDTEEDILASIYGPNGRPEMISEEDFKSQLSGTGTAFAGQKTTTEGFRDALNKRADEAVMSTDEILLSLGLGLMADPGKRGEELSKLGKAGITTMSEFGKRKDKAEGLRDKAMALDLKLGDAEIALEQTALKYGIDSKQFKAKEKQFDALYEQKDRLAKIEETGKNKRAETAGKYAVQAAEATAVKEYEKEFRKAVGDMQQIYLTKDAFTMGDLRQVLKEGFDPKDPKYKSNIAGAQAYLRNMKGVYETYGKSYKGDSDLVELEKRLEGTNTEELVTGKDGKNIKNCRMVNIPPRNNG